jgi:hypothetical protein
MGGRDAAIGGLADHRRNLVVVVVQIDHISLGHSELVNFWLRRVQLHAADTGILEESAEVTHGRLHRVD